MTTDEAKQFISSTIPTAKATWADIGAGAGTFTKALDQLLLPNSTIYAVDTSTNDLQNIQLKNSTLKIIQEDFNQPLHLPMLDGVLMANALHYSKHPIQTLENILPYLRVGGTFILMEYELERPRGHWIPYPIPFQKFQKIAQKLSLSEPIEVARKTSVYGNNYIYLAKCTKV